MSVIGTRSGILFNIIEPIASRIDLYDISGGLSNICRFGGQSSLFYSVAQHSVLVSMYCAPEDALWGLLHDATEAFIGDIIRPLKHLEYMSAYRDVEKKLGLAVAERFGLNPEMPASVKAADDEVLWHEAAMLMPVNEVTSAWYKKPSGRVVIDYPWSPAVAEARFLMRYREITGEKINLRQVTKKVYNEMSQVDYQNLLKVQVDLVKATTKDEEG